MKPIGPSVSSSELGVKASLAVLLRVLGKVQWVIFDYCLRLVLLGKDFHFQYQKGYLLPFLGVSFQFSILIS